MEFVSLWEWGNRKDGGYTNDAADPGGETKYGISKRAHPDVDIPNLTLDQAKTIYRETYWDGMGCDRLSDVCIAVAIFDSAVNCGIARTAIWLDGTNNYKDLLEYRKHYYQELVKKKPLLTKFLKGWLNRVSALLAFCHKIELDTKQ